MPEQHWATAPTAYLKSSLEGLALVKEATYLTNASHMSVIEASGPGYRDSKGSIDYAADGSSTKTSGRLLFLFFFVNNVEDSRHLSAPL